MKTKLLIPFLLIFPMIQEQVSSGDDEIQINKIVNRFFEEYIKLEGPSDDFVNQSVCLTKQFKEAYRKLIADAFKKDPELGLDVDPILNAQDVPVKPFQVISVKMSGKHAKVQVRSDSWPEHVIPVVLVESAGKWLIDSINGITEKTDLKPEPTPDPHHDKDPLLP